MSEKIEQSLGLYLISSKFGWILTGRYKVEEKQPHETTLFSLLCPINSASDIFSTFEPDPQTSSKLKLEDFWNLETIGIKEPFRETDDDLALERFSESVRFENNCYQVTWPWKEEDPNLPARELRTCTREIDQKTTK